MNKIKQITRLFLYKYFKTRIKLYYCDMTISESEMYYGRTRKDFESIIKEKMAIRLAHELVKSGAIVYSQKQSFESGAVNFRAEFHILD